MSPSLVLAVNRSVAVLQLCGASAAWEALSEWAGPADTKNYAPYYMVAASILERLGKPMAAEQHLTRAQALVDNKVTQRHLRKVARRLRTMVEH